MSPTQNVIRLCGSAWTPCGYCKGKRAHLVRKNDESGDTTTNNVGGSSSPSSSSTSSKSYSVLATNMTTAVYEKFINAGWRRSGVAIYRPANFQSCCPALTIRLPVQKFRPTKSQSKVLKRMKNLLHPGNSASIRPRESKRSRKKVIDWADDALKQSGVLEMLQEWTMEALLKTVLDNGQHQQSTGVELPPVKYKRIIVPSKKQKQQHNFSSAGTTAAHIITLSTTVCAAVAGRSKGQLQRSELAQKVVRLLQSKIAAKSNTSSSIRAVECRETSGHVLVHLSLQQQAAALNGDNVTTEEVMDVSMSASQDDDEEDATNSHNTDRLAEWWQSTKHTTDKQTTPQPLPPPPYQLKVTTIPAHESVLDPRVHRLYWEYQHVVHDDPDPFLAAAAAVPDGGSVATMTAELDNETNDTYWGRDRAPAGWRERADRMLLQEYGHLPVDTQKRLRRAFASFYEFLVENPFIIGNDDNSSDSCSTKGGTDTATRTPIRTGTYHQHYTLPNDVLVAVGVVDILPHGLSSVYLFYDPSFSHQLVPLGKYAILKEIEWTQEAGLPYYYLGYYIESCPKMKYKADYHPSELLCPTTQKWVNAELAKSIIEKESPQHHCCTLYKPEESSLDEGKTESRSVNRNGEANSAVSLDQIVMDVGVGQPVTLDMLHPEGQRLVRPLLEEYANQAGSELSKLCTVSFR